MLNSEDIEKSGYVHNHLNTLVYTKTKFVGCMLCEICYVKFYPP